MTPDNLIFESPVWPPTGLPKKLAVELARFTRNGRSLVRWYAGRTRFVCSNRTPLRDVPRLWEQLTDEIKQAIKERRPPAHITVKEAASRYFDYLDHRVTSGQPEPLAAITAGDYKRVLQGFAAVRLPGSPCTLADTAIDELGPDHFRAYALKFATFAPATLGGAVAAVRAFFNYCAEERHIHRVPQYGRYFQRPAQQTYRDRRLEQKKSYSPQEIWALFERATVEERAWLGLGLSGAMDNSDIAYLTFEMVDSANRCLDYRRRKTGKIPRVMPLHYFAWEWLQDYLKVRPEPASPAHATRVFLTPTGLPLQRMCPGKNGLDNSVDYLAMRWTRLMQRAGLRPKPQRRMCCRTCGDEAAGAA